MRGHETHRAPTTIGALTRKDRRRESALVRKIDDAYGAMARTSSRRRRRRHLRTALRHERALVAQRRRPQSLLSALALALFAILAAVVVTRASSTIAIALGAVLVVDLIVLRARRRAIRRS